MTAAYKKLALLFAMGISCAACRKSAVPAVNDTARAAVPSAAAPTSVAATVPVAAPVAQAPPTTPAAPASAKTGKNIHDVDVEDFLNTHYTEMDSNLENLKDECPEGEDPIRSVDIQYGDVDGDGQEEALFQGYTCMAGSSGVDYSGIVKLQPDGKLVGLPIAQIPDTFKGRDPFDGLRGHLRMDIEDGRFVERYPVYKANECEACSSGGERKLVFRWDGHQFVLDDIIDISPDKAGK
jgi:hypothetical protein